VPGCFVEFHPSAIPENPPTDLLRDLWPQINVILLKACKKFPFQTHTLEMCKHIFAELNPMVCEAMRAGKIKAHDVSSAMRHLLNSLLASNSLGNTDDLRQEIKKSDEWLALAEAVAEVQHSSTGLEPLRTDANQAEPSHAQNIREERQAKQATPDNKFVRDGDVRCISYGDETVQLPHLVGLEYIAILLRCPGKPIACTVIMGLSSAGKPVLPSKQPSHDDFPQEEIDQPVLEGEDVGDILDERAIAQYKKRARELEEEIKAAKEVGADWDINPRMAELEHIEEYLRTETWKGRSRKFSNDEEKARLAVKKAIDRALDKIAIKAPKAGTHLTATIQTGTSATYADITTLWKL
jgi:hypothetical protein